MIKQNFAKSGKIELVGLSASDLIWTGGLTMLAIIAPAILAHTAQNQIITGTIVNAVLFFASWKIGKVNAFAVASLPSTIALIRGLLPTPMALMIPYIILANFILIVAFSFFKKRLLLGVTIASLLKFGFLFSVATFVFSGINSQILAIFQLPQLLTALLGGFIAIGAIKIMQKK